MGHQIQGCPSLDQLEGNTNCKGSEPIFKLFLQVSPTSAAKQTPLIYFPIVAPCLGSQVYQRRRRQTPSQQTDGHLHWSDQKDQFAIQLLALLQILSSRNRGLPSYCWSYPHNVDKPRHALTSQHSGSQGDLRIQAIWLGLWVHQFDSSTTSKRTSSQRMRSVSLDPWGELEWLSLKLVKPQLAKCYCLLQSSTRQLSWASQHRRVCGGPNVLSASGPCK